MAVTTVSTKLMTEQAHKTRNRAFGIAFLVIAALTYWLFANGVDSGLVSTYGLNQGVVPKEERLPDWVVPSFNTVALLAVLMAAAGGYQLARGFGLPRIRVLDILRFVENHFTPFHFAQGFRVAVE